MPSIFLERQAPFRVHIRDELSYLHISSVQVISLFFRKYTMFLRHWIYFSVLSVLISTVPAKADILIFGGDASNNSSISESVGKNSEAIAALAAFERGDLQECERLLRSVSKSAKDLPAADIMIARLFMSKGKYSEALARLELYLMKGAQDAEAYATMGEIAFLSGRYTDAWLQFRESLAMISEPSSTVNKTRKDEIVLHLLRFRAQTAERRRDLVAAEKLYKELEKAMPATGFPLIAQARILIAKSEIAKGAELLRKARQIDVTTVQPELQIALMLSANGQEKAVVEKWFQDGLKQVETSTIANWSEYIKWFLIQGKAKEAMYFVEKSPADFRSNRLMKFLEALTLRYLGRLDEAEVMFSALQTENIDDLEAADQLALILAESVDQGKKGRAQQISETNLKRAPNEESIIATAAWIEFKLGDIEKAEKYLSTIVARGTSNPQTIYYIARLLESRNRKVEAIAMYQNALNAPGFFAQRSEVKKRFDARATEDSKSKTDKSSSDKSKSDDSKTDKSKSSANKSSRIDPTEPTPVPLTPPAKSVPADSSKAASPPPSKTAPPAPTKASPANPTKATSPSPTKAVSPPEKAK